MPMDFPDMKSLVNHARVWKFRNPNENETEEEYREALAQFVEKVDFLEGQEIRNKVGWDRFSDKQNIDMVHRIIPEFPI